MARAAAGRPMSGTAGLAYAPKGLIGVLTPQANTTVEPEFAILMPPGYGMIAARLTSDKPGIDARLIDYVAAIERKLGEFANAPVGAFAFACTGASYLIGPEREAETVADISARHGIPFITAADAIADALAALGANRIAIVSPYHDSLHASALEYWAARGFATAQVARITGADAAFHPIYALGAAASAEGLGRLDTGALDAVVMLGTGLPSLPAILSASGGPVPVLSSNLCLMWRSLLAVDGGAPDRDSLAPWLAGTGWGARLKAQMAG
ncbi:MAG: hypothetical protein D6754_05150 [Alphaproteobacteria bacterium]|nr:MAG: hypothetical protein D6754_05150 [Alphaproteobacteria bacterium]